MKNARMDKAESKDTHFFLSKKKSFHLRLKKLLTKETFRAFS
jgi:hypothetical protein